MNLLGKTLPELDSILAEFGLNEYALKLAYWLYKRPGSAFQQMDTLPKWVRGILETNFSIQIQQPEYQQSSSDGTRKFVFRSRDAFIETVYMPYAQRNTLCISSQAGCRFACKFCNTGKQGFGHQLSAQEIINQVISINQQLPITHIVFMGMGEPFDNTKEVIKSYEILTAQWGLAFGATKITVSTIGILEGLKHYVLNTKGNLAISMHSPFPSQRLELMPSERANTIVDVIQFLNEHPFQKPRRLSFEYLLLKGVNHSTEHAQATADLLKGLNCHVNLLPYNTFDGVFEMVGTDETERFRQELNKHGVMATLRKARGTDIAAACGLLSGKGLS